MLRRFSKRFEKPNPKPAIQHPQSGKAGGHGDHWGCIYRDVQSGDLLEFIRKIVERGEPSKITERDLTAYRSPGSGLRMCVLVVGKQVVSAYPEVQDGAVWPITISDIVPWANGVEGQVTGTCMDAQVSFFDTRFYANHRSYTAGETYNFRMGALTYKVKRADDLEAETGSGDAAMKVSLRGACAYMPAAMGNEGADIDDFWFHSPLEETPGEADFNGRRLQVYPITIAVPGDFEMRVPLYAAEHVWGDDMAGIAVEDDLSGFLWLQGHRVEKAEG
jgi:hypothetical protein